MGCLCRGSLCGLGTPVHGGGRGGLDGASAEFGRASPRGPESTARPALRGRSPSACSVGRRAGPSTPPPPPATAVPARHTRGLLPVSFACPVFSGTVLGTWWEFREGSVDEEGKSVLKHESASSGNTHAHPSVSQDKEEVLRGGRPSAGTARPSPRHTGPLAGGACWKTARPPSSRSWWWPCPLP